MFETNINTVHKLLLNRFETVQKSLKGALISTVVKLSRFHYKYYWAIQSYLRISKVVRGKKEMAWNGRHHSQTMDLFLSQPLKQA